MAELKEHERTVNFNFYITLEKLNIVTNNWYFDRALNIIKKTVEKETRRP